MTNPVPLQEPPLPRYRFNEGTGKWTKEAAPRESSKKATGSQENNFESSYDYFLRRSYATQDKLTPQEKNEREKNETKRKIDQFQDERLQDKDDAKPFNPRYSAKGSSKGSNSTSTTSSNPLLGFLTGISLGTLYNALVSVKGTVDAPHRGAEGTVLTSSPSSIKSPRSQKGNQLTFDDFHDVLVLLREDCSLSKEYEEEMYTKLSDQCSNHSLTTFDLFSFVVNHTYHPNLDIAVEMIFFAFDTENRGIIPVEALHPRVIEAWAEENTFGNLRDGWLRLAEALRQSQSFLGHKMITGVLFLNPDAVRALLCSSDDVFAVANSVNLKGGKSDKKKLASQK